MTQDTTARPGGEEAAGGVDGTTVLRVRETRDDLVILGVPGTEYELHLASDVPFNLPPGRRVCGEIHAQALRMHRADAGGQFIEPIYGMPRIVQGFVKRVDRAANRVLMEMPVPVWVTLHEVNSIDEFTPGELWNCYVETGTRFVPAV